MIVGVDSDLPYLSLSDLSRSCSAVEVEINEPLPFKLGYDKNWKYAVVKELLNVENNNQIFEGRQVTVGDVLYSINEHMTLDDDISDILLFLETLKECGFNRKLTFLDPFRVGEAAQLRTKTQSKDLLGFSRDIDYLHREKVYNSANLNCTAQRDLEWVAYLKHIGGPDNLKPAGNFKPSAELKNMVRRGIPAAFRSLIWQKVSLSSIHRLSYPASYYCDLLGQFDVLKKKIVDDIEKDVKRTFPEHDYFDRGVGGDSLRRVLKAYALHNPSVGYCQSLNFISGMMLLFLQEEDAFWLLLTVVDTLLPVDCYSNSMIGTHVDQLVFAQIIEVSLPKVHMALAETQMDLSLITVPWFMCLFVNTLRPEVTLRVWDMFLCEGSKVLFRISAALLKKNEIALISASTKDSTEVFMEMKKIGRNEVDADALIAIAYKSYILPPSKQRSMFTTSRSTGNLVAISRRSAGSFDTPLRKYNDFSAVPPVLTGMGVAHTGPVFSPSPSPIPLSPKPMDLESGDGIKHWNEIQDRQHKDSGATVFQKEITKMKSKSEKSYGPKNTLPLPKSCLSVFQIQSAALEMLKTPLAAKVQRKRQGQDFVPGQEESGEGTNDVTDCCFDRTAMMHLRMSAFKSISHNVEVKTVAAAADKTSSPFEIASPSFLSSSSSSSSDIASSLSETNKMTVDRGVSVALPVSASLCSSLSPKKSKMSRNASSLLSNILHPNLSSSSSSSNSSSSSSSAGDEYRSFKRADIERLRDVFRPILVERYLSLESMRREKSNSSREKERESV